MQLPEHYMLMLLQFADCHVLDYSVIKPNEVAVPVLEVSTHYCFS